MRAGTSACTMVPRHRADKRRCAAASLLAALWVAAGCASAGGGAASAVGGGLAGAAAAEPAAAAPAVTAAPTDPAAPADPLPTDRTGSIYSDRGFGTDAYGGPFDLLFNKGFAVAQWEDRNRRIFDHDYGWRVVSASLTDPAGAVRRAGGWGEVLKVQALPFYYGGARNPQWVTNWFGHVFEGGLSYRRLMEWNEARGLPLPRLSAAVLTLAAGAVNEAYETPPPPPGEPVLGNAGIVMDLLFFDPLGILLFSSDRLAHTVHDLGVTLWPSQASLALNTGELQNNGQAVVFRIPLPWTRHAFFLRTGVGVEGGLTWHRRDGWNVSGSVGMQSFTRHLDPGTWYETAEFSLAGGLWVDQDDVLVASMTVDQRTDRRFSLNLYPGSIEVAGTALGAWFVVNGQGRPYLGISGRTLGAGVGFGF